MLIKSIIRYNKPSNVLLFILISLQIMASFNIVIQKKKNAEVLYPLALRITKDRKSVYMHCDYFVKISEWDRNKSCVRKSDPDSVRLNNYLQIQKNKAEKVKLDLDRDEGTYSAESLKQRITKPVKPSTFYDFADEYFNTMLMEGNYYRHSAEKSTISHMRVFLNHKTLEFRDINFKFLESFRIYLKGELHLTDRSIFNHLCVICTIFNKAMNYGLVDQALYPFGKSRFELSRPESKKIGLSLSQIKKLESIVFGEDIPRDLSGIDHVV